MEKVETNDLGPISFFKVTPYRITHRFVELGECLGFCEYRDTQGSSSETTLRCLLDNENDLLHGSPVPQ